MSDDLFVRQEDDIKRIINLIKQLIKDKKELLVFSSYLGSMVASKACNSLVEMNYVKITQLRTHTEVHNGKRRLSLYIHLEKTEDFEKLYQENLEKKKEYQKKLNDQYEQQNNNNK